jgi:hypothetical protein
VVSVQRPARDRPDHAPPQPKTRRQINQNSTAAARVTFSKKKHERVC